jgi:hypothetical protein
METITLETLENLLATRFHGVLKIGRHEANGECCALELLSVAQGLEWTDDPEVVRTFDLRPLNDIHVTNAVRTQHLLPVVTAYAGSLDWPLAVQRRVVNRLLVETVRQLLSNLPNLTEAVRAQCINASTAADARLAAAAVARVVEAKVEVAAVVWSVAVVLERSVAADALAAAAAMVARMVEAVAEEVEAVRMGVEAVFIAACKIWLEAIGSEPLQPVR